MNQIIERLSPWAPTMLLVGLLATLAESLQESDATSVFLILVSLVGAALVLKAKRGLSREEVRVEIATGIRALVRTEARIAPAPPPDVERTLDFSGKLFDPDPEDRA